MTYLLDLPNELLYEIIDYLQLGQSRVWELAHVNHRIHDLAQPLLFRHANSLSKGQLLLLERTLKEKPGLKKAIQSYGPIETEPDGYVSPEDLTRIPGFVNLKKLQFRVVECLQRTPQSHHNLFQWDVLRQIEEIELAACQSLRIQSPAILINLFSGLPSVHTLTVTHIITDHPSWTMPLHSNPRFEHHRSNTYHTLPTLTTLKLSGFENTVLDSYSRRPGMRLFSSKGLPTILQPYTNLTTLHCINLFLFHRNNTGWGTHIYCPKLQDALGRLKGSLQELVLTVGSDENTLFQTEPLDLSVLTSLSILHISSVFLGWNGVFPGVEAEDRMTLPKRLPPNVEALRVDFNPPLGVFRPFGDSGYDDHTHLLRLRWEWLLLFPTSKMGYFPSLREVKMVEARPISNHEMIKWDIPRDLAELSEEADITMDIWICKHEVKKPDWVRMTKFRI